MMLGGLKIGFKDGRFAKKGIIINRILCYSFFSLPFLGWVLILMEIVSMIFNRGLGIIDVFSKTQVFSISFYNRINKIYSLLEKNKRMEV